MFLRFSVRRRLRVSCRVWEQKYEALDFWTTRRTAGSSSQTECDCSSRSVFFRFLLLLYVFLSTNAFIYIHVEVLWRYFLIICHLWFFKIFLFMLSGLTLKSGIISSGQHQHPSSVICLWTNVQHKWKCKPDQCWTSFYWGWKIPFHCVNWSFGSRRISGIQ